MASTSSRRPSSGSKELSRVIERGGRTVSRPSSSSTWVASTSSSSRPRAYSKIRSPSRPKLAKQSSRGRRRSSPTVRIEKRASFVPIEYPTPGRWATGRGARKASSAPGRISATPPGLASLPARRARSLLVPTPIDRGSRVSSRTWTRIRSAASKAEPRSRVDPVRSRKKSSMEATSTRGV